ncbi:unnamed protein product, partial [Heterosigma akashiwo]
ARWPGWGATTRPRRAAAWPPRATSGPRTRTPSRLNWNSLIKARWKKKTFIIDI